MSSLSCDNPEHEKCESCGGCVPCGCICHLAGTNVPEPEPVHEHVFLEMGLREFQADLWCPKCRSTGYQIMFHPMIIIQMGEEEYPCAEWVRKGLITGQVSQHLCVRCHRCNYGFPMKTADG